MKTRKTKTFVYRGFGFPITLIKAPMKKMLSGWVVDIDMQKLEEVVLFALIHKPASLTGNELRFMRKVLELNTTDFGRLLGVTHAAVVKWENETTKINPSTEVLIRLRMLDHLSATSEEFKKVLQEIDVEALAKSKRAHLSKIAVDATSDDLKIAANF